jgi:hypothetical protein
LGCREPVFADATARRFSRGPEGIGAITVEENGHSVSGILDDKGRCGSSPNANAVVASTVNRTKS